MNSRLRALALALVLASPGAQLSAADRPGVFDRIAQRGALRVGLVAGDWFPYVFKTTTGWEGYEIDLAESIARALEVPLRVDVFDDAEELKRALVRADVDLGVSKWKADLQNGLSLLYSRPHSAVRSVFLVNRLRLAKLRSEGSVVDTLSAHAATVGTSGLRAHARHLWERFPDLRVRTYSSPERLYADAIAGSIDAAFLDQAEAEALFLDHGDGGLWLRYQIVPSIVDPVSLVTGWPNRALIKWVDLVLESQGERPQVEELVARYRTRRSNNP